MSRESTFKFSAERSIIRNRLVFLFMLLLVSAMGITMAAVLTDRVSEIRKRLVDESSVRAKTIGVQVAPSLEFQEPREAQALLDHFTNDPRVRGALITDTTGATFASFGELNRPVEFAKGSPQFMDSENVWVSVPVRVGSELVGNLALRVSLDELRQEIKRSVLVNLLVGLAVITLTVVLLWNAVRFIIDPISCLAGTETHTFSESIN